MADTRTVIQRSRIMQSVRTKDTGPELTLRRWLHAQGYRFRIHRKGLPGTPDIVFPSRHKAIFVHGCFWHAHGCSKGKAPKSRADYWAPKLAQTRFRDARKKAELEVMGWQVETVWACELEVMDALGLRLIRFLQNG